VVAVVKVQEEQYAESIVNAREILFGLKRKIAALKQSLQHEKVWTLPRMLRR